MNSGKNMEEKDTRDQNKLREYKKPQLHVVGKTASLIRGDYGEVADQYRRYQPAPPAPAGPKPKN